MCVWKTRRKKGGADAPPFSGRTEVQPRNQELWPDRKNSPGKSSEALDLLSPGNHA